MTPDRAANPCQGCGTDLGDNPPSAHCGHCPPWECPTCKGVDSMLKPCGCWILFDGVPLADIKGFLADAGMTVEVRP